LINAWEETHRTPIELHVFGDRLGEPCLHQGLAQQRVDAGCKLVYQAGLLPRSEGFTAQLAPNVIRVVEPDPAKSREHVLLSVLAERRLATGLSADLGSLMQDVLEPPISEIGALSVDGFMKKSERRSLAAALNTLLASPSLASWRQGANLDVAEWMKPKSGRTPIVVVSVAHLDDEERPLVLGVLLEEFLSWVRTLPGSQRLRALLVFDEVYGFLPPHPANPPTKRPLVALMKQARGFGVGVVVATQNPMDLDYRALSNAGLFACGGGGAADESLGGAGVLREDAVVLSVDGISVGFLDAARDGDTIYVLVNVEYNPVLFVSDDAGDTWTTHKLPASYDKVEGVEDGEPGFYVLYPWQGHLYMLVAATTTTHGAPYWAIAEVDLTTNDYTLRTEVLVGRVRFDEGFGLEASSESSDFTSVSLEYGNVDWRRYDFAADTVTASGSIPLAGTGLSPRGWASADGRELVALTDKKPADAANQLCLVSLDTTTGGTSLASACTSRLRAPLGPTEQAHAIVGNEVQWVTQLADHAFLLKLEPQGENVTATALDLGPGEPVSNNFDSNRPRYGDFMVVATKGPDAMTTQPRPRLIHVSTNDEVEDVELPWTPCDGGGTCGYGQMGFYGTVRWILPMDNGNVLVFHVVGKTSNGTSLILLMTREHPTLRPASFEPLELGILPSRPELKPAPPAVQQCMRAVTCGYHAGRPSRVRVTRREHQRDLVGEDDDWFEIALSVRSVDPARPLGRSAAWRSSMKTSSGAWAAPAVSTRVAASNS
jgi:hypothetical protein